MNDNDNINQNHDSFDGQQSEDGAEMPLGDNEFDAQHGFDGLTEEAPGNRSINSGAIVLGIVVFLAAAGLFGMRTLTQASAVSTASNETEESIESFLEVIASRGSGDADEVVRPLGENEQAVLAILNESYASRQVPLENVQRNPFIIFEDVHQPAEPRETEPQPQIDPTEVQREEIRARFQQAGEDFRLRSVLMGSNPLANLNNEIVQEGDTVIAGRDEVMFTVETIKSDSVILVAEDRDLNVTVTVKVQIERHR